jgi:hypothetical protein
VSRLLHLLGVRTGGSSAVVPTFADVATIDDDCATGVRQHSSKLDASKLSTSLGVMKSTPLNAAFALYVERALCYESYKFLVDATAYADGVYATPAEQVSADYTTTAVTV